MRGGGTFSCGSSTILCSVWWTYSSVLMGHVKEEMEQNPKSKIGQARTDGRTERGIGKQVLRGAIERAKCYCGHTDGQSCCIGRLTPKTAM